MQWTTVVNIEKPDFSIMPGEQLLFVGSCFADGIGKRFVENKFHVAVNPYGVMYNPASIWHSVKRWLREREAIPQKVFLTLGTNHVYILRETGEIVDNCQKRPHALFNEQALSVDECAGFLRRAVDDLREKYPGVKVVLTVSPIRYAKYGFHQSAVSKAVLLLAADQLCSEMPQTVCYFPAYEIVNDELRDYRFYQPDMIHPSPQAVDYIGQRMEEVFLSKQAKDFLEEWQPVRKALSHRPFQPDSEAYKTFVEKTKKDLDALRKKYPFMAWP